MTFDAAGLTVGKPTGPAFSCLLSVAFGPPRVDRASVVRQLGAPTIESWILDPLLDAFEGAMVAAMSRRPKAGVRTDTRDDEDDDNG